MNINITKRTLFAIMGIFCIVLAFNSTDDEVNIETTYEDSLVTNESHRERENQSQIVRKSDFSVVVNHKPVEPLEIEQVIDDGSSSFTSLRVNQFVASIDAGDDRTPPLLRKEQVSSMPVEILEDEEKYLQFQAVERQKVMISYLKAAGPKMSFIRDKIAEGKQKGIGQDKIEEAQRKLQKMEQMVTELHLEYPSLKEMVALSSQ